MWHWLHKKLHALDPRARLSIGLACGLHLFTLVITICLHRLQPAMHVQINRALHTIHNPIIIIDTTARSAQNTSLMQQQTILNAPATGAQQVTPKIESPQHTTLIQTAPTKKTVAQKTKKETPKKKATPAKPAPKKVAQNKKETPKEKPKIQKTPKTTEKKPAPIAAPAPGPTATKPATTPTAPATPIAAAAALPDGPFIIARSAAEASALSVHYVIQEELLRVWAPPVGIQDGVSCTARITLDTKGHLQNMEIIKPSGLLIFDVSARAALQQASWPRGVWGTTLELSLQ